ncbi:MAG TPA: N-acetyl-gamma-glutamyl-phosphate reductase [Acidobacteriaceae bacterium]|nr:N-acetyl-gamma-glutamyl-phosphate reductase [Acidobacteriaceae bacterium]
MPKPHSNPVQDPGCPTLDAQRQGGVRPGNDLRVAVAGVTGYAGAELARLLLHHPRLSTPPVFLGREGAEETLRLTDIHPTLSGTPNADAALVVPFSFDTLTKEGVNLLFLALPHEQSRDLAPIALQNNIKVVDLSAAWRLQHDTNRAVYKLHDANPDCAAKLQAEAVYGSPELHAPAIRNARLVANPGCYATSVILALAPLVRANILDLDHGIVADAKSGVSGAGKAPTPTTHFMHAADNLSAYAVFHHRHTGELLEQLQLTREQIIFTPHLLPIPRGILSTVYLRLNKECTAEEIQSCFDDFYANAPLVRIRRSSTLPQIQHVARTNFCDLGFQLAGAAAGKEAHRRLIVISCLDNLLKGAASQAVENMNLMAGFHQQEGLL